MATRTSRDNWESGEIVVSAVIARIPYGPDGSGDPVAAAFGEATSYVRDQARMNGEPWDAGAEFTYDGSRYTVRGESI